MSPQVSNFIHVARWVAALAVLITHVDANALVVLGDMPPEMRGAIAYGVWFFYGFAHHAVVVFFVLSGFLVGGGVIRAVQNGKAFLGNYLVDRTVRIYVVLIPVLVATALLDALGRQLFADTGAYLDPAFLHRSSLFDFAANLASLQDIFFPYFGTNSALWTLAHEYWYYVTFGLLAMPLARAYAPAVRWSCGALGVILLVTLSSSLSYHLFGFALWCLGAVAAALARPMLTSARLSLVLFAVITVGLRLFLRYSLVEVWWIGGLADLAVALAFANLLLTLRFDAGAAWKACAYPLHARLSDFSYSLYAVHMPVVIFLCAAAQHVFGFGFRTAPAGVANWLLAAGILCSVVLVAWLFSQLTEANTQSVRRTIRSWLDNKAKSGTARTAPV